MSLRRVLVSAGVQTALDVPGVVDAVIVDASRRDHGRCCPSGNSGDQARTVAHHRAGRVGYRLPIFFCKGLDPQKRSSDSGAQFNEPVGHKCLFLFRPAIDRQAEPGAGRSDPRGLLEPDATCPGFQQKSPGGQGLCRIWGVSSESAVRIHDGPAEKTLGFELDDMGYGPPIAQRLMMIVTGETRTWLRPVGAVQPLHSLKLRTQASSNAMSVTNSQTRRGPAST